MILTLLLVTATFRPPAPTVGDPITIDFVQPVTLDRSEHYEIVSGNGRRVVVRTFEPKPFAVSGTMGDIRFRNLVVPVHSVLKPQDLMTPAPLEPPHLQAMPRRPFIAIGIAALVAAVAWLSAWLLSRRKSVAIVPPLTAAERFRRDLLALRGDERRVRRWAALADATRAYLAATQPHLGAELTTTELVARLADEQAVVADILRQGDLEKFSLWGASPMTFEVIADRALDLIPPERVEVAA